MRPRLYRYNPLYKRNRLVLICSHGKGTAMTDSNDEIFGTFQILCVRGIDAQYMKENGKELEFNTRKAAEDYLKQCDLPSSARYSVVER